VNLNYTAGAAGMSSAAKQAGLRSVVTSRAFLEKAKLELPEGLEPIWIDEVAAQVSASDRLAARARARVFAPARWIERYCGAERAASADDVVTVIFSSGSTGEPKGVMLSHANIASNCAALDQIFHVGPREKVLGILPFFHSFGFTATIWFPATSGLGAVFHPSPIDAPAIGELVERHQVSFLLATPTLLSIYCGASHRRSSVRCDSCSPARRSCPSGSPTRSKISSASARSKATARPSARP
jgi:acyl-[acyl-carrier-protein]-phospholipid O-acyltransferase/long-chain-fatty-acid--[acyl-carrier-protein] ligase